MPDRIFIIPFMEPSRFIEVETSGLHSWEITEKYMDLITSPSSEGLNKGDEVLIEKEDGSLLSHHIVTDNDLKNGMSRNFSDPVTGFTYRPSHT